MTLKVGDLAFEVRHSPRRKSLQITVDRGGELIVTAPVGCPVRTMEGFVREKRGWIYRRLAEKEALGPRAAARQFVSGEGFLYLGRSYRLLLVDGGSAPLLLERGRFRLRRRDRMAGREHLVKWYVEHARPWIERRVAMLAPRVGVDPGPVQVKDLGYRWGSCAKSGRLYFHWRTILLPPTIVEYVVAHELTHLRDPHHTPSFWSRLERVLPDASARRSRLAETGAALGEI